MGRLIYSAIMSLDGYVEDAGGEFGWAAPDGEVHAFVNDLIRPVGTYLYGRRMYEVMQVWEQPAPFADGSPVTADFAEIWTAADKVVYSTTLAQPATPRTRVERVFEPDAVRRLKLAAERDIAIGGANLAAQAIRAGVVDEFQLFLTPIVVGAGKSALPPDVRLELDLVDHRRFGNGVVFVRYRVMD
ncbi:MAG: dihydrofolate reductase family protein [Candidatus Nanopelagicales bacterium]